MGDEPIRPTESATEAKPAVPAAGHSIHSEAFNDGPRRSASLLPGMGTVPFPVTTAKPEAQAFVNQGVGQLHSFYYFEAERSFRQAANIDPDCAMTYWGMAMANVNNAKRARGFLAEARSCRDALEAGDALSRGARGVLQGGGRRQSEAAGLLLGLEAVVQEFPADIDARAWLAMVTWQNSSQGRDRQPQGGGSGPRIGPPGRVDAPRCAPLPHPPLERRQIDPCRVFGRPLCADRAGSPMPGTCRGTSTPT